jgi:hypothetical protein
MNKLDVKQINLIKEIYEFVDEDPDAISGVPPYAGILAFYWEYAALSIPHLVDANLISYSEDVNKILADSWNEICARIEVDPNYKFKNIEDFIKKCEKFF